MSAVLSQHPAFKDEFLDRLGFAVKDVRVSPDHTKAFILWDSYNGQGAAAEAALKQRGSALRAAVSKAMGARSVPLLVFRRDALSAQDNELDRIFREIREEERGDEGP